MLVTELTPDQIAQLLRMVVTISLGAGLLGALSAHLLYDAVRLLARWAERKPVSLEVQLRRAEMVRATAERRIRMLKGIA